VQPPRNRLLTVRFPSEAATAPRTLARKCHPQTVACAVLGRVPVQRLNKAPAVGMTELHGHVRRCHADGTPQ
jgi:hypothetical protein